jgi:D-aminopeptidase
MTPSIHSSLRARDLGVPFEGMPGLHNAITDVAGVEVGFTTLIEGEGELQAGKGTVRTGVTAVLPRGKRFDPVFSGWYTLNGNGEMTGTIWIEESGYLEGPVIVTNTNSIGVARDAVIAWQVENKLYHPLSPEIFWLLPVVAETYDGRLNDIHGFHVKPEHVIAALDGAKTGQVAEGNVGGGTGMICHEFKGGTGTASRVLHKQQGGYTVGVLLQANHGSRSDLRVAGIPVGKMLSDIPSAYAKLPPDLAGMGSIIVVIATDAPLLPHQLKRIARRAPMGIARLGSNGEHYSGDIFIAFSTANPGSFQREGLSIVETLANDSMNPLFAATAQAVEEAILNALVAAQTMTGVDGNKAYALPHDRLRQVMSNPYTPLE